MKFPECLKLVTDMLWRIEVREDLEWIVEDLLTPGEIVEIADRILIMQLLKEWKSQRQIAEDLGISVTTVSRGSRLMQFDRKAIHKYL